MGQVRQRDRPGCQLGCVEHGQIAAEIAQDEIETKQALLQEYLGV